MHAVTLFAAVLLKLVGQAKVHWTVSDGESSEEYNAEEFYINGEVCLVGSCECISLSVLTAIFQVKLG